MCVLLVAASWPEMCVCVCGVQVSGVEMRKWMEDLLPIILDFLQDSSSLQKREVGPCDSFNIFWKFNFKPRTVFLYPADLYWPLFDLLTTFRWLCGPWDSSLRALATWWSPTRSTLLSWKCCSTSSRRSRHSPSGARSVLRVYSASAVERHRNTNKRQCGVLLNYGTKYWTVVLNHF